MPAVPLARSSRVVNNASGYKQIHYQTVDGLTLFARDYNFALSKLPPLLAFPASRATAGTSKQLRHGWRKRGASSPPTFVAAACRNSPATPQPTGPTLSWPI